MRDEFEAFLHRLDSSEMKYCIIDSADENLELLISESCKIGKLKAKGWKEKKDKSLYLYGLKHRLIYINDALTISCNYKLACKSILNGAWVPLDRSINDGALDRVTFDSEKGYIVLSPEDEICYLLASCIYTLTQFSPDHKRMISDCMNRGDKGEIKRKLSKVFFSFTDKLLQMIEDKEYDEIIPALYAFGDY